MSYSIKLEHGKYLVVNDNGSLTILRHGAEWPAAEELKHVGIVLSLAQRIEELEVAIGAVMNGSLDSRGMCNGDGLKNFQGRYDVPRVIDVRRWDETLRKALDAAS